VEALWHKLGVEESEQKTFMNGNRGCGVRQINEFEDELARLNELKHQNLHLFVEDARCKLQELWDALYLSEDEMLEFTPAFSDVFSDALLEAHEREIARLDALREQRAPTLALVEKHRSLVSEQRELLASAKDASRLMMRGQKGEKRDPGKLLREEKMRKRIAKELPKVSAELRKGLEKWEEEYGRPFLVHGDRYLNVLEDEEAAATTKPAGPRSKTPANPPASAAKGFSAAKHPPPSRSLTKTPTAGQAKRGQTTSQPTGANNNKGSPSRIPARAPLANLKHGNNSPERQRPESRVGTGTVRGGAPLMRAPPPKMRDLIPPPALETPSNPYRGAGLGIVRNVEPEDVYDDRAHEQRYTRSNSGQSSATAYSHYEMRHPNAHSYPQAPPPRQISNTSHSTAVSGSENWETYDDNSEPELDTSDTYYAKVRATRPKRIEPESGHIQHGSQSKRLRGIPPATHAGQQVMVDQEGNRIVSASDWTDEDAF